MGLKKITFTDTSKMVAKEYHPVSAQKAMPDWYREAPPYLDRDHDPSRAHKNILHPTIKRCVPIFDAISSGYLIKTHRDLDIEKNIPDGLSFFWPPGDDLLEFHSEKQLCGLPGAEFFSEVPKFMSPWAISTPRGYSSLFISPMYRESSPIKILSGIVDTDSYNYSVNLPFLVDPNYEGGIIPAGTPIAQVIPFKRDSFKMNIGGKKSINKASETYVNLLSVFLNGYRKKFWSKKSYK
jgi:hypothetical protein